jgi:glyoxylase-like metal-dependent hydrolase (beta-lactamase superfamily II)
MRIGDYEVLSVNAGRFKLDGGAMFGVVPKVLWSRTSPADEVNRIDMAMRCLLIRGRGRILVVDTGAGDKFDETFAAQYSIHDGGHGLVPSLRDRGVAREDVTDVILTHLHFDHCGGTTVLSTEGLKLQFPNARHHVQKEHWEHALQPSERDRVSFLRENFELLDRKQRLSLLEGETELLPGVTVMPVFGHTPAMQLVRVEGGGSTLLYGADLFPLASHLRLPYIMSYDLQPMVTLEEKRRVLPRVVDDGWVLVFEHDPLVEAARLRWGRRHAEVAEPLSLDDEKASGRDLEAHARH